jgi:alpha-amylase
VPGDFWKRFSDAVGVYTIGEVFDGDFNFLKQFVGPMNSLLNYPHFYWLKSIFNNWEDMSKIETFYGQWKNAIGWS